MRTAKRKGFGAVVTAALVVGALWAGGPAAAGRPAVPDPRVRQVGDYSIDVEVTERELDTRGRQLGGTRQRRFRAEQGRLARAAGSAAAASVRGGDCDPAYPRGTPACESGGWYQIPTGGSRARWYSGGSRDTNGGRREVQVKFIYRWCFLGVVCLRYDWYHRVGFKYNGTTWVTVTDNSAWPRCYTNGACDYSSAFVPNKAGYYQWKSGLGHSGYCMRRTGHVDLEVTKYGVFDQSDPHTWVRAHADGTYTYNGGGQLDSPPYGCRV